VRTLWAILLVASEYENVPFVVCAIVGETSEDGSKCMCSTSACVSTSYTSNAEAVTTRICCIKTHAKQPPLSTEILTGKGLRKRTHFDVQPLYGKHVIPCTPLCFLLKHESPNLDRRLLARAFVLNFLASLEFRN
jgi:hypothetical protein